MNEGPSKEPTPPDSQIREALMTLPCEVIALACVEKFSFKRFEESYSSLVAGRHGGYLDIGILIGDPDSSALQKVEKHWKTLKQDLDRTRFLAPGVLREKMKQELTKKALTKS